MRKAGILFLGVIVTVLVLSWNGAALAAADSPWESWTAQSYSLRAEESFQFRVQFADIPVRRWQLVVDGGDRLCDVSVLRVNGESLVYYETRESRHEVSVPWGREEEILVMVTNRTRDASFVVTFLGPPRQELQASYSYHVNRALEHYASGQSLEAEKDCRRALVQDPGDAVAKVLLAGFLRDKQFLDQAAVLVDEAIAGDLPDEMQALAENLQTELLALRAPLPQPVLDGVAEAAVLLNDGKGEEALAVCDGLLDGKLELDGPSRAKLLGLRGRSLEQMGRNFAAVDAYTRALAFTRSNAGKAVVYFHMGQLFDKMGNAAQAQGAFTMALQQGLPSGLEIQAREALQRIAGSLQKER